MYIYKNKTPLILTCVPDGHGVHGGPWDGVVEEWPACVQQPGGGPDPEGEEVVAAEEAAPDPVDGLVELVWLVDRDLEFLLFPFYPRCVGAPR